MHGQSSKRPITTSNSAFQHVAAYGKIMGQIGEKAIYFFSLFKNAQFIMLQKIKQKCGINQMK